MDYEGKEFVSLRASSFFTGGDEGMAREVLAEEVKRLAGIIQKLVYPKDPRLEGYTKPKE
jgi:hypothetical protein